MDTTYYPYAGVSCSFFLLWYNYGSPAVSEALFPAYKLLPRAKQIEWHTRTKSSVHAVLVSTLCLYVVLYDDNVSKDPVWGNSPMVKCSCAIVVGYMASDTIVMLVHYRAVGELFYIFHHGASIYAYYFVMTYGALPWFANFRLIAEFSTPFVNQRWFLDVLGYPKTSTVFLLNGIAMAVMFFLVRIASIPPYWYKVYTIYGTPPCIQLGRIWYVLLSSCIILDLINVYWFLKIFQGARKVLRSTWEKNNGTAIKAA
ncbi:hypothetical protein NP493_315g01018 [Ridgeia piscesae]|uniref:TLC domain-containing protein n=1 Tax=Ridgeia piscesae TaxID=27915 RepID=A0AAD9L4N3_RIDPI|nr:hypothetical protein NP493_315g01018 [Ridgeia piscesae]